MKHTLNVMQFICPTGFYGAERWILALTKHLPTHIKSIIAVTQEPENHNTQLIREAQTLGFEIAEFPMTGKFDWSVVAHMVQYIKAHKIDIIHTHGYKSDILGVIVAKKAGIKVVVTPHGFENASDVKLRTFIWLGCQAMSFADHVVPLSPALHEDVEKFGLTPPKLRYIQNGVDLSEVYSVKHDDTVPAQTNKKRIGFIGLMISRKNIDAILQIFSELAATREDIELVLLGDGDCREALERRAQALDCRDDIHFLGFRDDRLALLKTFDLFVMTSTLEGIPRCLMEACAMGIPVAAYDIDGIDQLIHHEQTGLLAPLHDIAMLKRHWETLLDDTNSAQVIAENAVNYVQQHYSSQRMANEYDDLFQEMMTKDSQDYVKA